MDPYFSGQAVVPPPPPIEKLALRLAGIGMFLDELVRCGKSGPYTMNHLDKASLFVGLALAELEFVQLATKRGQ
jgi:hypothetical protein